MCGAVSLEPRVWGEVAVECPVDMQVAASLEGPVIPFLINLVGSIRGQVIGFCLVPFGIGCCPTISCVWLVAVKGIPRLSTKGKDGNNTH
jgi:hypothetical protein